MFSYEDMEEMYEILAMEDENGLEESFFVINSIEKDEVPYFLVVDASEEIDYDNEVKSYLMKGVSLDNDNFELEMMDEGVFYDEIMALFQDEDNQDE